MIEQLRKELKLKWREGRVWSIGIAGGSGAGKTTLAQKLANLLDGMAVVIEQDSYYKCRSHLPPEEREKVNFDHPDAVDLDLLTSHLRQLKRGMPVERPIYDFTTHTRKAETLRTDPVPVVIVEGLFLFVKPDLRNLFDFRIFVDADPDIRFIRRLQRDLKERGRTLESVIRQYIETVKPMHDQFIENGRKWAHCCVKSQGDDQMKEILECLLMLGVQK